MGAYSASPQASAGFAGHRLGGMGNGPLCELRGSCERKENSLPCTYFSDAELDVSLSRSKLGIVRIMKMDNGKVGAGGER